MSYKINEAALKTLALDKCEIVSVTHITGGTVVSSEIQKPVTGLPDFYRVCLTARPGERSNVRIEVWLPSQWNERLLGMGNGGMGGRLHLDDYKTGVFQTLNVSVFALILLDFWYFLHYKSFLISPYLYGELC